MEPNVSHLLMLCNITVVLVNPAAICQRRRQGVLCHRSSGLLVTLVSVTVVFELSAMTTYSDLRRVTLLAFSDSHDLHNMLERLLEDPWAAEVRAALENRWQAIQD